jgi:Zn-dependent membrane protease YugP
MYFSPLYFIFALPALILGLWAQLKVQSAFKKYSKVRSMVGFTGAEVARRMLDQNGLQNVQIEMVNGFLSDHYDPAHRVLRLSPDVYRSNSLAAAGIAAHEAGHALQHKDAYFPLQIRTAIVPAVQIGSWLGPIIFVIGMLFSTRLAWAGLILFAATAVFSIITLPVEFNATHRAKEWLANSGSIYGDEARGVSSVLDAAALTYVAAAIQAISTVLYYLFLLGGRSRD